MPKTEATTRGVPCKQVFLKISQKTQEIIWAIVSFLITLQASSCHRCFAVNFVKFLRTPFCIEHLRWLSPVTLLKKRLCYRCFPVNLAKYLRTPFLQNNSGWLLLLKRPICRRQVYLYLEEVTFGKYFAWIKKETTVRSVVIVHKGSQLSLARLHWTIAGR